MADYIKKRSDGRYRLNFRVPVDLVAAVGKLIMNESLGTADKGEALVKAKAIVENYRSAWDDLRNGQDSAARLRFDAARAIARRHGLPYRSEFAGDASLSELLKRVEALVSTTDIQEKVALAGGVRPVVMKLSEIVKEVESHLRVELASKSDKKRHKWRLPRDRAVRNFIAVVGDREINAITRDDALDFRDWWAERMLDERLSSDSPNKDFQNLGSMLSIISKAKRIETGKPFEGLRFSQTEVVRSYPFSRSELSMVLAQTDSLNEVETALVAVMAGTGLRPSEAINSAVYNTDVEIPFVEVVGPNLKSPNAARRVPLVGRALQAAIDHSAKFADYYDKEDSFCTAIGGWLGSIFPNISKVSAYSFRHAFQDRLTETNAIERVQADLMGHAISRERYGSGPSLDQLRGVIEATRVD